MTQLDETFGEFWAAWPKKVKRQAAKDAVRWALHHYDNPAGAWLTAALATIAWQKRFYGEARFFPDPNRWILDMRWTDEDPEIDKQRDRQRERENRPKPAWFDQAMAAAKARERAS